jgi:adenylate kinase
MAAGSTIKELMESMGHADLQMVNRYVKLLPQSAKTTQEIASPRISYARRKSDVSQRGETWNDTEAINRHREMTPTQRVALAIQISRAALRFAHAKRVPDDRAQVRAETVSSP